VALVHIWCAVFCSWFMLQFSTHISLCNKLLIIAQFSKDMESRKVRASGWERMERTQCKVEEERLRKRRERKKDGEETPFYCFSRSFTLSIPPTLRQLNCEGSRKGKKYSFKKLINCRYSNNMVLTFATLWLIIALLEGGNDGIEWK